MDVICASPSLAAGVDNVAADDALLAEVAVAQETVLAAAPVPASRQRVRDAHPVLGVAVVLQGIFGSFQSLVFLLNVGPWRFELYLAIFVPAMFPGMVR